MNTPSSGRRRLGPYEILAPLGAGGMGEVFRARDPRLKRDVAVKVLPGDVTRDPERLGRFAHEAEAAAALNHPNLLAVYDVGSEDGAPYIVSELLAGETLRERLRSGALPVSQAVETAAQVAAGLAAAHHGGIVHRDLKPENLFLCRDGRVKILDFGIAKLTRREEGLTQAAELPTLSATAPGVVVGTAGYMSPEQVQGLAADARSDIFALGAVLYEMLTGRRAFHGGSPVETMAAIVREEPTPITELAPAVPPALERLVQHCLEKDPARRWQTAHDLALQLGGWTATGAARPVIPRSRRGPLARWGLATAALLLAAAAGWLAKPDPVGAGAPTPVRATILPPKGGSFGEGWGSYAFSPDGRTLAFTASAGDGKRPQLWLRPMSADAPTPLPGTEGGALPFWAPDGRHLGYFTPDSLFKIAVSGGPPQRLCGVFAGRGGSWGREGTILFAPDFGDSIWAIPAAGGEPRQVTRPDSARGEWSHRWPTFLPDGKRFLYLSSAHKAGDVGLAIPRIVAASLEERSTHVVVTGASNVAYSAGHLVFVKDGNLVARSFDLASATVSGEELPISGEVRYRRSWEHADFAVSLDGALAYRRPQLTLSRLVWVDRQGRELSQLGEPGYHRGPQISPDGTRVAVVRIDPRGYKSDIWIYETSFGRAVRATRSSAWYSFPVWSPDGTALAFGDGQRIGMQALNSGAPARVLATATNADVPTDWSRDGRYLTFDAVGKRGGWDIWMYPLAGEAAPKPLVATEAHESAAAIAPDGKLMAYTSTESGVQQIYVRAIEGAGGPWQASSGPGHGARWRGDGRELYYLAPEGLMAVAVTPGTTPSFGVPRRLFEVHITGDNRSPRDYDFTHDGTRFLLPLPISPQVDEPQLELLSDWRARLASPQ